MDWLIKLLGGYTRNYVSQLIAANESLQNENWELVQKIKQSRKNDTPKDPKTGRFIKVGK